MFEIIMDVAINKYILKLIIVQMCMCVCVCVYLHCVQALMKRNKIPIESIDSIDSSFDQYIHCSNQKMMTNIGNE